MLSAREANRSYFREAYRTGQHGWAADQPSAYVLRYLERLSRQVPGGELLDVGCGEGRHSFAAARLGFRVTGVDYEPLALRRARRLARAGGVRGVAFRQADVFSLPFSAGRFDVVLDYGCLHHQRKSDWRPYREAILRMLKPDGFYLLSAFSPRFRLFRGSRRRWHVNYGAYRRCFTRKEIAEFLGAHFDVVETVEEGEGGRGFLHVLAKRRGQCDGQGVLAPQRVPQHHSERRQDDGKGVLR